MLEEILVSFLYFLLINFPAWNFFYDKVWFEIWFNIFWNQILSWIISVLLIYLFHLLLLLLWRLIYTKLGLKRKSYWNIYILAFVLRIFPIVWIISSFLLWTNSEKLWKVIKIFTIWFILYTIISYLIFKFFNLTWLNIFWLFL